LIPTKGVPPNNNFKVGQRVLSTSNQGTVVHKHLQLLTTLQPSFTTQLSPQEQVISLSVAWHDWYIVAPLPAELARVPLVSPLTQEGQLVFPLTREEDVISGTPTSTRCIRPRSYALQRGSRINNKSNEGGDFHDAPTLSMRLHPSTLRFTSFFIGYFDPWVIERNCSAWSRELKVGLGNALHGLQRHRDNW